MDGQPLVSYSELKSRPMSGYQILMVVICFVLNFNDGIDVLIVSFSSYAIMTDLGLSKVEMGYIFSAGLAGMTLGCLLLAPLADKIGRRKIFLIAVALITFGMYGVWLSQSYTLLLIFRLLTGLGIGGILPTMAATATEFSNEKYRDFNVSVVQAGWPIGAIITGILCAKYLPAYGWHSAFFMAGNLSLLMWFLVYFFMSDSLEFLLSKSDDSKAAKLASKLGLNLESIKNKTFKPGQSASLGELLKPEYARNTLIVWTAAFFGFLTLYTLMSWVPTLAKDAGLAFEVATWVGIMLNIGAALGSSSIGWIGSKLGLQRTQFTYMLIAFAAMLLYAFSTLTPVVIFTLVFLIGFFVQGGFNGIWAILARIYPTHLRSTGVGLAAGFGRFGAILGPLIFAMMLDAGYGIKMSFIVFSIPLLLMGLGILLLKSREL